MKRLAIGHPVIWRMKIAKAAAAAKSRPERKHARETNERRQEDKAAAESQTPTVLQVYLAIVAIGNLV